MSLIQASLNRSRTVLMLFTLVMLVGIATLISIPKESNPDITVPFVYVSVTHDGISPEDADALIYKQLEKELRGLDGLKEMVSTASTGHLMSSKKCCPALLSSCFWLLGGGSPFPTSSSLPRRRTA